MSHLIRAFLLRPAYVLAAPVARLSLWLMGCAMTVAALGALALTTEGTGDAWGQGAMLALAAAACFWLRSVVPYRP